jgi:hypothetical protein
LSRPKRLSGNPERILTDHLRRSQPPEVAEAAKEDLTTIKRESPERIRKESTLIRAEGIESREVETSLLERTEVVGKDKKDQEWTREEMEWEITIEFITIEEDTTTTKVDRDTTCILKTITETSSPRLRDQDQIEDSGVVSKDNLSEVEIETLLISVAGMNKERRESPLMEPWEAEGSIEAEVANSEDEAEESSVIELNLEDEESSEAEAEVDLRAETIATDTRKDLKGKYISRTTKKLASEEEVLIEELLEVTEEVETILNLEVEMLEKTLEDKEAEDKTWEETSEIERMKVNSNHHMAEA